MEINTMNERLDFVRFYNHFLSYDCEESMSIFSFIYDESKVVPVEITYYSDIFNNYKKWRLLDE